MVQILAKTLLLPAFGKTFKDLEAIRRKETRLYSAPAPSVFLICLEEGQALNQKSSGLGGSQRLNKIKQQQKKTKPQLHIWRRTPESLPLKHIPVTDPVPGCRAALPLWVAFTVTEATTHKRSQLPDIVQGSPKLAFSRDTTAM